MERPDLHPALGKLLAEYPAVFDANCEDRHRFLDRLDAVLQEAEADRRMARRSLEFSAQELLKAHEEVHAVLRTQPDIICHLDADGVIRSCSTSSYRDLVHAPQKLIGRRIDRIPEPRVAAQFRQALAEMRTSGRLQTIEYELDAQGHGVSYFEARLVPMGSGASVVVIRNVDERKRLEAQLLQAQKLESIGHLASGIAHEINTPTQYITDNTRFLQDAFADLEILLLPLLGGDDAESPTLPELRREAKRLDLPYLCAEVPRAIEQSLEGLGRIARIVAAMKEFSHPGSDEMTPTDLNRALENTATVSKNEWKYVADLTLDLDPDLPPVLCLPAELNQVFLNIIVNAAHAMVEAAAQGQGRRGRIGISTHRDGDWAEIRFSDTGTGIPKEIQNRIFDPFFTTKPVGRGTGQGLAISRSVVVDKHGGTIAFETQAGVGTTFIVRIPIRGMAAAAA